MESTMGIGQAARLLGTTVKTLQRWEREGRLVPTARTASNRRRYTESQLRAFLHLAPPVAPRRTVAYCRVSSAAQRPDLVNQRSYTAFRAVCTICATTAASCARHWRATVLLAHRIRIEASAAQRDYFVRAAGTARRVWNWAPEDRAGGAM